MFEAIRRHLSLPLLGKELLERAVRRNTYIVRIVVGIGFLLAFWMVLQEMEEQYSRWSRWNGWTRGILGSGGFLLQELVKIALGAIFLFLPSMMSSLITYEKERGSLELLLLAGMSPTSILVQKFISGLLPMVSLLLIALPLGGLAYNYGGVSPWDLAVGAWVLSCAMLQIGSLALLCSCFCRTSFSALGATYIIGALMYSLGALKVDGASNMFGRAGYQGDWTGWITMLFPGYQLEALSGEMATASLFANDPVQFLPILSALASSVIFLLLARFFLIRRAFLPARPMFARAFRYLDGIFTRLNHRAGGVRFGRDHSVPDDEPVAWRELARSSLGSTRYLVRLALTGSIIALPIPLFFGDAPSLLAAIGLLFVVLQGTNLIISERVNQTLDLLLATPMHAEQIVRQKWRALSRFAFAIAIPVAVGVAGHAMRWDYPGWDTGFLVYVIAWVLALWIYPKMFGWLAILIGLHVRTRARAALIVLGILVAWFTVPIFADSFIGPEKDYYAADQKPHVIEMLSPARILSAVAVSKHYNSRRLREVDQFSTVAVNFLGYGLLLFVFRGIALRTASRGLRGRQPSTAGWRFPLTAP